MINRILASVVACAAIASCRSSGSATRDTTAKEANVAPADTNALPTECGSGAGRVVARLGEHMRLVSLLAPDSVFERELADAYTGIASPELLAAWQAAPDGAPGREVSSPWPARIDVRSIQPDSGFCRVEGDVIYVTSADTGSVVERRPVTIRVNTHDSMHITAYQMADRHMEHAGGPAMPNNAAAAADVVRQYYRDISAGDYARAYALWGQSGRASGKTAAEFASGFAHTARVHVTVTGVPQLEGAAGSEYATVSVAVDAVQSDGRKQHFTGTYTLRRVMADGATAAQRRWHIYSAHLTQ